MHGLIEVINETMKIIRIENTKLEREAGTSRATTKFTSLHSSPILHLKFSNFNLRVSVSYKGTMKV